MAVLTTMQSTVEKPQAMEESDSESSQDGCEEDFDTSVIEEYSVPLQLVSFNSPNLLLYWTSSRILLDIQ